jgi:hypothetical protein
MPAMATTCDSFPLSLRKTNLARLLSHRSDGMFAAPGDFRSLG